MTDPQPLHPTPHTLEVRHHPLHSRPLTRHHHRRRPVDRGQPDRSIEQRRGFVLRRLDSRHHTTGRQGLHQPATRRHQPRRITQREHPRHKRSRDLTDRMPHQPRRPHTPRLKQPEQTHLHGEQRRLRIHRPIQQTGIGIDIGIIEEHIPHRPLHMTGRLRPLSRAPPWQRPKPTQQPPKDVRDHRHADGLDGSQGEVLDRTCGAPRTAHLESACTRKVPRGAREGLDPCSDLHTVCPSIPQLGRRFRWLPTPWKRRSPRFRRG